MSAQLPRCAECGAPATRRLANGWHVCSAECALLVKTYERPRQPLDVRDTGWHLELIMWTAILIIAALVGLLAPWEALPWAPDEVPPAPCAQMSDDPLCAALVAR